MAIPSTPDRPYGEFAMRYASRLDRRVRLRLHRRREELFAALNQLDAELQALTERRTRIIDELGETRDRLWPRVEWCHGRRPPRDDQPPSPPSTAAPLRLGGRPLRSACLALFRRYGRLRLDQLHALIHLHGYVVASEHPVKALADAMSYELHKGRLRRPERGTYELAPGLRLRAGRHGSGPSGGLGAATAMPFETAVVPADPVLVDDPSSWYPEQERAGRAPSHASTKGRIDRCRRAIGNLDHTGGKYVVMVRAVRRANQPDPGAAGP